MHPSKAGKVSLERGPSEILPVGPLDARTDPSIPNLNTASVEEISHSDFVGPTYAKAIVDLRTRLGGFERWDQLAQIEGLKANKIAELQRAFRLGSAH
ncbi:MAG: helix-hairpin-helix domain-containing protein [Myxococcales bacterium]